MQFVFVLILPIAFMLSMEMTLTGLNNAFAVTPPNSSGVAKPSDLIIYLPWESGEEGRVNGCGYNDTRGVCHHTNVDAYALDFNPVSEGGNIYAVAKGKVVYRNWANQATDPVGYLYGKTIVIHHDKYSDLSFNYYSQYSHLNEYIVNLGDNVSDINLPIGIEGMTGNPDNTGIHLHFAMHQCLKSIDIITEGGNFPDFSKCRPVVPEPFVGQKIYEGLGWWNINKPNIALEAWRPMSEDIVSPTSNWGGQSTVTGTILKRGERVKFDLTYSDAGPLNVAGVGEIRATVYYTNWSNPVASQYPGFDSSLVWRIIARCNPIDPNAPCNTDHWYFEWDPYGETLYDDQGKIIDSSRLLPVPWLPKARPVVGQSETGVCISFDVFDFAGNPHYAPLGGVICNPISVNSAYPNLNLPLDDNQVRYITILPISSGLSGSDNAQFISDISLPDGTVVSPAQSLNKTWRVKNTGSSTWGSDYKLVFIEGDQMGGPVSIDVPNTAPGQEVDLSVPLTAPSEAKDYVGRWRLRNPQGTYFGDVLWVKVRVKAANAGSGQITLFDISPASPSSASAVHIVGRARYSSDLRAMRFVIGDQVREMTNFQQVGDQWEISFDWNTASLPRGNYAIALELAKNGDLSWSNSERQMEVYTLTGAPAPGNRPPERPLLKSPYNWYLKDAGGSSASVELCVYPSSDPDGDPVQYWFEVKDQGGGVVANSGWTGACWSGMFNPNTYSWRVKAGDGSAESGWSQDTWNFTVAKGGVYIGDHTIFSPNTNDTHVCIYITYDGIQAPEVYAWLNKAPDGSENGEWRLLDHYGPNAGPDCTQPNYHGFWIRSPEYESGNHKLRFSAVKRDSGANASKDTSYSIAYIRPSDVKLLTPSTPTNNGTWWKTRAVHFEWAPSLRADNYTLRASTQPNPWADPSPVLNQGFASGVTSFDYTFLQDYAKLYWSVRASNSAGSADSGPDVWSGIDTVNPTCQVQALPAATYENVFQVNWSGTDDSSGVQSYDVQVRDSSRGEWRDWLLNALSSKPYELFNGQPGHTYYFRCRSMDKAGNSPDSYPATADTSIKVDPAARPPAPWWDNGYSYKRNLTILNNMAGVALLAGYPVRLHLDSGTNPTAADIYDASQSPVKCNDVRIVYNNTTELNRIVDNCTSSAIDIWFRSQVSVPGGASNMTAHQVYYGNPSASSPPADRNGVFYPIIDSDHMRVFDMREGSGSTTTDATGNASATIGSELSWTQSGKFGPAILIPGDQTPEPRPAIYAGFGPQPGCAFTAELWLRRLSGHQYGGQLIQQENGWSGPWRWAFMMDGDRLKLSVEGTSDHVFSNGTLADPKYFDSYHHIAVTHNCGGEVRFYIDGALDSVKIMSNGNVNSASAPLRIGNNAYSSQRIAGYVFGTAVSNIVRTDFSYGSFGNITSEPTVAAGQPQTPPSSGSPDLVILDLSTYPNPSGGTLVHAIVQNQGSLDTLNGFFTDLYVDHMPTGAGDYSDSLQFWVNDPIRVGQVVTLTTVVDSLTLFDANRRMAPVTAASEVNGTLYAQTDSAGAIQEPDKVNNITTQGVEFCLAAPDLYEDPEAWSNLLSNGGFEQGAYSPTGDPFTWTRDAWKMGEAIFTWDDTQAYGGNKSVKLTAPTPNDIRWLQSVALLPNTNYRLSGWIKTENVVKTGLLDVGANIGLFGTWMYTSGLLGTNDWTYASMDFNSQTMTQTVVAARLGYWSGDVTGMAWFDDIRLTPLNTASADDDTPVFARPVVVGQAYLHNFHKPDDQDWMKFDTQAGGTYAFSTSGLGLSADTYLYLYDTDGATLLASNDDFGGSLASSIQWTAPAAGTYYLLARHWNPSASGCGMSYTLSLNGGLKVYLPLVRR